MPRRTAIDPAVYAARIRPAFSVEEVTPGVWAFRCPRCYREVARVAAIGGSIACQCGIIVGLSIPDA